MIQSYGSDTRRELAKTVRDWYFLPLTETFHRFVYGDYAASFLLSVLPTYPYSLDQAIASNR